MFAVIYIPDFALQAVLRHETQLLSEPVALLASGKAPVWQVTPAAAAHGVLSGVTSTQAKARCDKIAFRLRSIPQEDAAQEILLEVAYHFAAFIESTLPGICTLDLRGLPFLKSDALEHSLEIWSKSIQEHLRQFHLDARIGVARAPGLALQAAQSARSFRYVHNPDEFWKELPIRSTGPNPELLEILSKWGIHTVSEFLALGKARIADRLGSEGVALFESARADDIRPLKLTAPSQMYEEFFEFEQPVETIEPLLFIIRRFLEQLVRRIEPSGLTAQELLLRLRLESGETGERNMKIPSPTRDANILFRILHNYLETVRTTSPVIGVCLRLKPCAAGSEPFQLFETAIRDPNRFYETVGRLSAWLGADRVGIPAIQDSHRPDDVKLVPLARDAGQGSAGAKTMAKQNQTQIHIAISTTSKAVPRGPLLRRLRPPRPATVRLHDGQPVFINSTGVNSVVVKSAGPWRRSGNWWDAHWSREEWDVETKDGRLYRIFREGSNWFLDGAYD